MQPTYEIRDRVEAGGPAPSAIPTEVLSPAPILDAVENFHGTFVDLDRNLTVDAASLASGRTALARRLASGGLAPGDRVLVAIGNGPAFAAALAATLEIGASPLLAHYQLPPAEMRRTALRYGAAFVLADGCEQHELAPLGGIRTTLHDLGWIQCSQTSIDEADPAFSREYPALRSVPLHPTSGSTNVPKIAARPGPCAIAEAVNYIDVTGVDRRDTLLVVTPMSHAYAYGMGLMVPLLASAKIVSMRRFALKTVLEALDSAGVTVFPAVPAMLDMLLFGKGGELLARPRMVLSAGVGLPRRTAESFQKVTGRLICPLYGTTETGGISVGADGIAPAAHDRVGPAMRGVRVRLEPPAGGTIGEGVGRVAVRSTSMMAGYLSPTGIDATPLVDGWFLTGDLGRFGAEGGIQLVGRESDVINVSGMKVIPSEVEEVLNQFPGVLECKVYAGERRPGHQFVKAAVVAPESFDMAPLRDFCQEQLVYYKRPAAILRLDALPRSPAGKILKDQLP